MNIYLVSDDYYFSYGMKSKFLADNQKFFIQKWKNYTPEFTQTHLRHGDIILLDSSTQNFLEKSISHPIISCKVNVLILHTPYKHLSPIFKAYSKAPKNLSFSNLGMLIHSMKSSPRNLKYCPGHLTATECLIIRRLYEQASHSQISEELAISIKTVSTHKVNALRKLGVRNFNQLYFHN
ncbi:helix-turn-helix transcriptional regulator [Pantoea cypripedii]|uniref:helix-turn-helix domain-containing protein n=1 Tax=Pantoea cypripedii TaxID=55209 RepID=UPI002FC8D828